MIFAVHTRNLDSDIFYYLFYFASVPVLTKPRSGTLSVNSMKHLLWRVALVLLFTDC